MRFQSFFMSTTAYPFCPWAHELNAATGNDEGLEAIRAQECEQFSTIGWYASSVYGRLKRGSRAVVIQSTTTL